MKQLLYSVVSVVIGVMQGTVVGGTLPSQTWEDLGRMTGNKNISTGT